MFPRFGETEFSCHKTNETNKVLVLQNVEKKAFLQYRNAFLEDGFEEKESFSDSHSCFSALSVGGRGVFIHYFSKIRELTVAEEENCAYFTREDPVLPMTCKPQITQLHLTDFGLSYAVRLSDGRFIVLDGGWDTPEDQEALFRCLSEQSDGRMPRIACWILTHPHGDHHRCFNGFWKEYHGKVKLDSVLWHFPKADDVVHYPYLAHVERGTSNTEEILRNEAVIKEMGVKSYTAHTGQIYCFGDARLRILACMENTIGNSSNINTTSLVIRMELAGQVILWTGDAYCKYLKLAERYGSGLKADILQVFHHGFSSGKADAVIAAYNEISAPTCLIPATDKLTYSTFCIHQPSTRHLFDMKETSEVITGEKNETILLPYTPALDGRAKLSEKIIRGLALCGKTLWNVSAEEKTAYKIQNLTHAASVVTVTEVSATGEKTETVLEIARRSDFVYVPSAESVSFSLKSTIPVKLTTQEGNSAEV